jgi:hypothetical protein
MNMDHLLFRRQFFLSPQHVSLFPSWKNEELPDGYHLTAHPDLKITRFKSAIIDVTLLGFILDPQSPEQGDYEILEKKAASVSSINELITSFDEYAGRYVCIVFTGGNVFLFADTLGFRTVYYRTFEKHLWCSSQPSLLGEYFNLKPDKEIEDDLKKAILWNNRKEHWYPGTSSAYKDILRLLPNHYLDCSASCQIRYWPAKPLKSMTIEKCVEESSVLLQKTMESASKRFDLEIAVTAGLDSRMVLAGCHTIKRQPEFFTHTHPSLSIDGADIRIASMMCQQLGLEHKIIRHSEIIDSEFERIIRRNVTNARSGKMINAFTIYNHFTSVKKERVVVHGVPGEIARNFFYKPPLINLDIKFLLYQSAMSSSRIAEVTFEKWLNEARKIPEELGVRILDLFYWEQRVGSWASMSYNEYDIAFESFTPFSCRRLLTLMLGVESHHRVAPNFTLQRGIINHLWPELLHFEINPAETFSKQIRKLFKNSPVYKVCKTLSYLTHAF